MMIAGFFTELEGFEPSSAGVKVLCLTAWRQPNGSRANGGTQTPDLLITNQLLYRLSYISARRNIAKI